MKITLVLAAVAAYVYAEGECCEDIGEYEAGCIPEALQGPANWTARFTTEEREGKKPRKTGSDALLKADFKELRLNKQCRKGARQFDAYCHQYNVRDGHRRKTPKYTDYKFYPEPQPDEEQPEGFCNFAETDKLSQVVCLREQCMFEYCIYRRDEWIDECEEAAGDIELPKEEPGWGDVYDYGNMHADLESNR